MYNDEEFTFKNKVAIENVANTLERILIEHKELPKKNSQTGLQKSDLLKKLEGISEVLIEKAKSLLNKIYLSDDLIRAYLDEKSPYTRNNYKNHSLTFNTFSKNTLENLIPFSLENVLIFIAFLSVEITYRHYSKARMAVDFAPLLKDILEEMESFHNIYSSNSSASKNTPDNKNRVKYYLELLLSVDSESEKESINSTISNIEKLQGDAISAVENAEAVIPKVLEQTSLNLSKSFEGLLEEKIKDKKISVRNLKYMGSSLAIAPLLLVSLFLLPVYDSLDEWHKLLITFSVEGLLIYFFRIILIDYYKIKTEIIQLETRKALTNFLPSYVFFSSGKESNPVLEHFSNFIFKPLVPNAEDIPKVTDGIEPFIEIISKPRK